MERWNPTFFTTKIKMKLVEYHYVQSVGHVTVTLHIYVRRYLGTVRYLLSRAVGTALGNYIRSVVHAYLRSYVHATSYMPFLRPFVVRVTVQYHRTLRTYYVRHAPPVGHITRGKTEQNTIACLASKNGNAVSV